MVSQTVFAHPYLLMALLGPLLLSYLVCVVRYWRLPSPGRHVPMDMEMAARGSSTLLGPALRQVFACAMTPVADLLLRAQVNPNTLTLLCCVLSVVAGGLIAYGAIALGGVVGLVGSSLDYLDGRIARQAGKATRAGNFLDSTLDRYSDVALLSGAAVFFHHSVETLLACLLSLGAGGIVSYSRAKAESLGLALNVGLMQRPERIILFCLGTLCSTVLDPLLSVTLQGRHVIFAGTLYVLALLTTITAGHRTVVGFWTLWHRESAPLEPQALPCTAPDYVDVGVRVDNVPKR